MYDGLNQIPDLEIFGPEPKSRIGILPFNLGDLPSDNVARRLNDARILVRSGHHCTIPLMKEVLHRSGAVRASTYFYNTQREVGKLISAVEEIARTGIQGVLLDATHTFDMLREMRARGWSQIASIMDCCWASNTSFSFVSLTWKAIYVAGCCVFAFTCEVLSDLKKGCIVDVANRVEFRPADSFTASQGAFFHR